MGVSAWGGIRGRGSLGGTGKIKGEASSCSNDLNYTVEGTISGSIGVDYGGNISVKYGATSLKVGIYGSGTLNATGVKVTSQCSLKGGCNKPQVTPGGFGGSVGVTFNMGMFNYNARWDIGDIVDLGSF